MMLNENELSKIIVDTSLVVHKGLGPGLFESVYEEVLAYELANRDLEVSRQVDIPISWNGHDLGTAFKADIIVNSKVIIELKSVKEIQPVHSKQLLTYLKLADIKLGLLINFNESLIKNGIQRVVNGL